MSEPTQPQPALASLVTSSRPRRKRKSAWPKWVFFLVVVAGACTWGFTYFNRAAAKPVEYRTVKVSRGDVTQVVTANGPLTPVRNVQVGSQISGTIIEINADFNSRVKEGDVIARIDPATYERNLAQAEAELANATAGLELAKLNFKRAKELIANNLISESEFNQAEVSLQQADAVVKMRESNVERAKVDLGRTIIYAPIDGVVISRNIEVGQTVAASFNTPTLFLIANDLSKMQIEAAVSEADVGGVESNQEVTFSVEAFLARQFKGKVNQVRYAPTTNQNVVTYTTIVELDNPDLKLRPGMTANASIITAQKKNTLRLPNAALRFRPPDGAAVTGDTNVVAGAEGASTQGAAMPTPPWIGEGRRPTQEEREKWEATLTPEQREQYRQMREQMRARFAEGGGGAGGPGGPSGPGGGFRGGGGMGAFALGAGSATRPSQDGPRTQTVYVLENENGSEGQRTQVLKAVKVKTGITDGNSTELLEGLEEGDVVVTGLELSDPSANSARAAAPAGSSPFGGPFGPRRGPR